MPTVDEYDSNWNWVYISYSKKEKAVIMYVYWGNSK